MLDGSSLVWELVLGAVAGQGQYPVTLGSQDPFKGPDQGNWTVENCIIARMVAQARLDDTSTPTSQSGIKLKNATVTATKVQLDAFRAKEARHDQFQIPLDCAFHPNDVVPIIVGCALAGLVVLVLIAYLVGRRKSRARGYQSV